MGFYRKKPVVVEAVPFTPLTLSDLTEFLDRHQAKYRIDGEGTLLISTLEGDMFALEGDWVICGVHGEVYPCKAAIFMETYDSA